MAKYNSVPGGRVGSGEAYVLPQSKALENLTNTIDYNRKMGLLNINSQRAEQMQTNKDFADNDIKAKSGILFQDDLNKATQNWIDTGVKYRTQGFNPFQPDPNDPNQVKASQDYLRDKAMIEGMADTRDIYQKNFLEQRQAYEKGGYDEDSWNALNDFYKQGSLPELYKSGALPPTLMKQFDTQEFMKGVAAPTIKSNRIDPKTNIETKIVAPNESAISYNIENSIEQNPQAKRWFNKTFNIDESKLPAKMFIGSSDPAEITKTLDDYYRSPKGMIEAAKAFTNGVVPSNAYSSPEYQKFLNAKAQEQLTQEQRREYGFNTLVKQKAATVNQENEKSYNFDLENQGYKRQDQQQQNVRFGWAAEDQANAREDRSEKKSTENLRDRNIQGIQVGNRADVYQLRQLAKSKGGNVVFDKKGNMVVDYYTGNGVEKTRHKETIDLSESKDDRYAQINNVFNDLTGKKIDIETLQNKSPYKGGIVNVGDKSLTKSQIEMFRQKFKTPADLGEFFIQNKLFKTSKEALEAAGEILDKKGRIHKNVNKPPKNE